LKSDAAHRLEWDRPLSRPSFLPVLCKGTFQEKNISPVAKQNGTLSKKSISRVLGKTGLLWIKRLDIWTNFLCRLT